MVAVSGSLLRAGLALKLGQIKSATRSYLRDRTDQAAGSAASYAIAAGLFAAAGIFLIAAGFVGITALFRWIELRYGPFWAFGAVGTLLVVIAAICAALAAGQLRRPQRQFPSLTSRLRVAIKANPIKPARVEAARNTATAVLRAPPTPIAAVNRRRRDNDAAFVVDNRNVQVGLIVGATLLGWAATRRRRQARRTASG
jgi:hypothetical protein